MRRALLIGGLGIVWLATLGGAWYVGAARLGPPLPRWATPDAITLALANWRGQGPLLDLSAGRAIEGQALTAEQQARYDQLYTQLQRDGLTRLYQDPRYEGATGVYQAQLASAVLHEAGVQAARLVASEFGIHPDHPPMVLPAAVPADIRAKYPDGY